MHTPSDLLSIHVLDIVLELSSCGYYASFAMVVCTLLDRYEPRQPTLDQLLRMLLISDNSESYLSSLGKVTALHWLWTVDSKVRLTCSLTINWPHDLTES